MNTSNKVVVCLQIKEHKHIIYVIFIKRVEYEKAEKMSTTGWKKLTKHTHINTQTNENLFLGQMKRKPIVATNFQEISNTISAK